MTFLSPFGHSILTRTSVLTMGDRSVDPLQCFTYLKENVPSWITKLSDLIAHTTAKRAEFITPADVHPTTRGDEETSTGKMDIDGTHLDPVALLKLSNNFQDMAQRKRRLDGDTSKSANDNHPRHLLIVHYDSETQSILDELVWDIGGARNTFRKGRMAQTKIGFSIRKLPPDLLGDDRAKHIMKASITDSRSPSKGEKDTSSAPAFDLADKQLELAQSLCESAAHQFLRNGDCSTELENTKERFSSLLNIALAEVERLEAEAKLQTQQAEKHTEEKPEPKPVKQDKNPQAVSGVIEVDDASSMSSISIDLTAFRSTRFRI